MNNLRRFIYSFAVVAMTAWISSYFTRFGINNWYDILEKPSITPPNTWFPFIWGILYILMVISFYIILRQARGTDYSEANRLFLSQLLLQILWCFSFFYMGFLALALGIMFLLLWAVWRMLKNFRQTSQEAAILNYPYFLWLIYACLLNISVVYLNGFSVQI